jgi:hypothetical protein
MKKISVIQTLSHRCKSCGRLFSCMAATAVFCFFVWVPHSKAADLLAELTAGYDSNPALTDPSDGSRFSVYGLGATHSIAFSKDLALHLSAEGRYQDYWTVGDNYRLQGGTALSYVMAGGTFLPSLLGEVAAYRDRLNEADERNESMVGFGADWILSKRLTLGFEQTIRWLVYLNPSKPFSGKGQGRNMSNDEGGGKGGGGNGKGTGGNHPSPVTRFQSLWTEPPSEQGKGKGNGELNRVYSARNNRLISTGLDLNIFILPALTGRVYGAFGNLDSSLDMESFREIQAGAALSWEPVEQWLVSLEATWYRTQYYDVPENITTVRHVNYSWSAGLQASRFWRNWEFFGQVGWRSGQAPLNYESYTGTVIQCGLSYSFSF